MPKKPFIPPYLPPQLDFSSIFSDIIKARDIVARYDEAVKRLPNPEIIQRSFETKEAVLSSKIEGTQATFDEVLMFDAQDTKTEESEKEKDYKEISNYRWAIKKGKDFFEKKTFGGKSNQRFARDSFGFSARSRQGSGETEKNPSVYWSVWGYD